MKNLRQYSQIIVGQKIWLWVFSMIIAVRNNCKVHIRGRKIFCPVQKGKAVFLVGQCAYHNFLSSNQKNSYHTYKYNFLFPTHRQSSILWETRSKRRASHKNVIAPQKIDRGQVLSQNIKLYCLPKHQILRLDTQLLLNIHIWFDHQSQHRIGM